jgi:hypothetical protein
MVTDEVVEKALELVSKGGGNYQYFFGKLNSPDWIAPLQKKGRFSHPPVAIVEETSIRFPRWPEGEYLVRMAPLAPDLVFGAIDVKVYESDNHYVHQILLQIAAELPVPLAVQVALAEAKWASQQRRFLGFYEEKVVPVILNLAAEGRTDAALALLNPLLHVEAAPQRTEEPERSIDGRLLRLSGTPLSRIDSWNIQRLLLQVSKALAEGSAEHFLALLSEKVDAAVGIYVNERGNGEDYSLIWRPRIDSGRFGDLMDTLVSATRDAASQIVQGVEKGYEIVLNVFGKHGWPIFRRLEYHALSQADNLPVDFVNGLVSKDSLYEDQRGNPEFNDFLSKFAVRLPEETRNKLLAMVDAGPDLGRYSSFLEAQGDKREVAERWIVGEWRLGWLTVLNSIAGEARLKQLDELLEKHGPPRPAFSIGGRAIGHTSDITQEILKRFSIPDLVAYLKKWAPPPRTHLETPSRAGIGRELQTWVSEDPALFSDNLASFQSLDLHPTYLRSMLDAFTGALKGDRPFDPYKIVATVEWLLSNTSQTGDEHYEWDEDPGWSWAHMSSARFLTELFLYPERLDISRHNEFWPALELIAENPSPTEKDETEYRKNADFGMLALNSTRPVGLESVIRYARWLKQSAKDMKVDAQSLPKPFKLLASHLDPEVDNSVAVRETYGMQFSLLAWLDQGWWEQQLTVLFPEGGKLRDLDRFAWNSYLRFSRPLVAMLPAMRFRYERAINGLEVNAPEVSDSERSLGNHFMQYYAAGAIQLDDTLLTSFFAKASPALKAQTIGDVGWHLGQEGAGELGDPIRKRLMDFWEYRLAQGMKQVNASKQELGGFGWWFASKKFPDDWSIQQLVAVVETFHNINPDFAVVKRLAELAQAYPYEAVRCLGIIFEEDRDGWAIHGWAEGPQTIISEALKGNEQSRAEADRVVNLLVARGHRGFRNSTNSSA